MTTLRYPHIINLRVLPQARRTRITARSLELDGSYVRAEHSKPRRRGNLSSALTRALLIGRELLLALWTVAALAFCLVIVAGFVL